jgi:hypothetical protein
MAKIDTEKSKRNNPQMTQIDADEEREILKFLRILSNFDLLFICVHLRHLRINLFMLLFLLSVLICAICG